MPAPTRLRALTPLVLGVLGLPGSPSSAHPQAVPAPVLDRYAPRPAVETVELDAALEEVSGLAFDDRGRLWAHHDEAARIYELDPSSGAVLGRFDVRRWGFTLGGDWEGIAWTGDRFVLVDSEGVLLEVRPGAPGERVRHRRVPTGLGRRCEIEGLGWDPGTRALLVGCKRPKEGRLRGHLVLFSVPLAGLRPDETPHVLVEPEALRAAGVPAGFAPSAVEVHGGTGSILVASARPAALLELAADGTILATLPLPSASLPQVEGLAVDPEGALVLASEGAGDGARLARLVPKPEPGAPRDPWTPPSSPTNRAP